ncbi:hypothetical protein [Alterisphingorhabdus coralli]|uniref:Lipoprotein n=1 Tax=Alterisphingorhabdus coralli TaxID=3071408 RepID=A0AA97F5G4_9SPHN|nr:hypothetical protein [Parasphingorhabdus sp. SCSIO 66989]WOE74546.1 hypothetical protein RB602_11910 [Parasphingorhabdus sp. SCSIO 66989]
MKTSARTITIGAMTVASLALTACDGLGGGTADPKFEITQNPDACFRAVTEHLGADTKVLSVSSLFSAGSELSYSDDPKGQMTNCTVDYQDPDNADALLRVGLKIASGEFTSPKTVDLTVIGIDPDFNLDEHLIALGDIDSSGLAAIIKEQEPILSKTYETYGWSAVSLEAPDNNHDAYRIDLRVRGLKTDDPAPKSGAVSVSVDGKTVSTDHLIP